MSDRYENKRPESSELARKNRRVALLVLTVVFAMGGLAFASVPLYDLFCRVTGWGGTTQVASALPDEVSDRQVTVKFTTRTAHDLPWRFKADLRSVDVNIGQQGLVSFSAKNLTARPNAGTAIYNVTPAKVGKYFNKIQCFCFARQEMQARQEVSMPVVFFLDPEFADDPSMEDVTDITLSYVFYKQDSPEYAKALENLPPTITAH